MQASSQWEMLGGRAPRSLESARGAAHWAAQIVAAVGATLLEKRADASHTALVWHEPTRSLVSEPVNGVRAGLVVQALRLVVLRADGVTIEGPPLSGRTLARGLEWMAQALARATGREIRALVRPEHDMPSHPVSSGAAFAAPDGDALVELARWYGNAARLLDDVARSPGASPVRCWPHHFDMATSITLDAGKDPEHARSIIVGLSPGDASYAQPYWYVNPWPRPKGQPSKLAEGVWHTEGWLGAVLTGERVVEARGDEQPRRVRAFVDGAIGACRAILA